MLYLVSTPIGNLGDISLRAKETLASADLIACEDTRTTRSLLTLLGIKHGPLTAYHEHNADKVRPQLIEKLKKGIHIALVSDAGTPLISDPGYRLVRECREQNLPVTTIPGANAVLSALQLSGLPSDCFYFGGFLPSKQTARQQELNNIKNLQSTVIFYDTPNRLVDALSDILSVCGNRKVAVVREITKKFEETRLDSVQNLIDYYTQNGSPKGELVLVIDRSDTQATTLTKEQLDALILKTVQTSSAKETAELIAGMTGLSKKQIYKRVVELKNG
ncbi:MAG: 16S rRNA (cytidine(1402)-2'-O)-methyltransferase [Alphaproteobacteria bacterium]|nr:16S rRNA (cytidine(1402)-2'-O)-methyltransferase [Alphaproteobacteria bacterium]